MDPYFMGLGLDNCVLTSHFSDQSIPAIYRNRIKAYTSLLNELEELMIQAEFKWYAIAEGELTATDINKSRFETPSVRIVVAPLLLNFLN